MSRDRGKPTVEGALHAFLDTDLDLYIQGGEGWRNYAALGAQVANTPNGAHTDGCAFRSGVLRLIELLKKALPDCAEQDIFWGYHFVTGALMLTLARTGRIDKLSGGLCRSEDFVAVKRAWRSFMAPASSPSASAPRAVRRRSLRPASAFAPLYSLACERITPALCPRNTGDGTGVCRCCSRAGLRS
jgi:hypothetical protein